MSDNRPIGLRIISGINRILFFLLLLGLELYMLLILFSNLYPAIFVFIPLQLLIILAFYAYKRYIQGDRMFIIIGILINIIVMGIFFPTFLNSFRYKVFQILTIEPLRIDEIIDSCFFVIALLLVIILFTEYLIGNLYFNKMSATQKIPQTNQKFGVVCNQSMEKERLSLPNAYILNRDADPIEETRASNIFHN